LHAKSHLKPQEEFEFFHANFIAARMRNRRAESPRRGLTGTPRCSEIERMQHLDDHPHDDMFAGRVDPEFSNEAAWLEAGTMRRTQPSRFAEAAATPSPGTQRFSVDWIDGGRGAGYPADPSYPNGVGIDVAMDAPRACRVELPWPANGVGLWVVVCGACGYAVALGTAGRSDDPRTVRVPCRAR
jgi:hypothetical protein